MKLGIHFILQIFGNIRKTNNVLIGVDMSQVCYYTLQTELRAARRKCFEDLEIDADRILRNEFKLNMNVVSSFYMVKGPAADATDAPQP